MKINLKDSLAFLGVIGLARTAVKIGQKSGKIKAEKDLLNKLRDKRHMEIKTDDNHRVEMFYF